MMGHNEIIGTPFVGCSTVVDGGVIHYGINSGRMNSFDRDRVNLNGILRLRPGQIVVIGMIIGELRRALSTIYKRYFNVAKMYVKEYTTRGLVNGIIGTDVPDDFGPDGIATMLFLRNMRTYICSLVLQVIIRIVVPDGPLRNNVNTNSLVDNERGSAYDHGGYFYVLNKGNCLGGFTLLKTATRGDRGRGYGRGRDGRSFRGGLLSVFGCCDVVLRCSISGVGVHGRRGEEARLSVFGGQGFGVYTVLSGRTVCR